MSVAVVAHGCWWAVLVNGEVGRRVYVTRRLAEVVANRLRRSEGGTAWDAMTPDEAEVFNAETWRGAR